LAAGVVALAGTCGAIAADRPHVAPTVDAREHVVFQWRTDRCEDNQYPDAPARAFRDAEGRVHLFASHYDNRAFVGASLDSVRIDCRPAHEGRRADDPAAFDDRVWLTSFHTRDGRSIVALGHAEYHGHLRPALCPWRDYRSCWWNAVVGLGSSDGGRTFRRPEGDKAIVAAPRGPYDASVRRPVGYFSPSNMIERQGWLYAFVFAEAHGDQKRGPCLLRSAAPHDPAEWRAWDGKDFTVSLASPAPAESRRDRGVCAPVPGLGATVTSVVRHEESNGFIALIAAARNGAAPRIGVYFSTSQDLLHWSSPQLLFERPIMFNYRCEDAAAYGYPALLDSDSQSRNFETVGSSAWLYLTRFMIANCRLAKERDLVRYRVHFAAAADR
jgi:hypothetical protein